MRKHKYHKINDLFKQFNEKKDAIHKQLSEFDELSQESDERIFTELCFCILTSQSKARVCDKALERLKMDGVLLEGTPDEISTHLKGVRFHNNKAEWIVAARKMFHQNGNWFIKKCLSNFKDTFKAREWLVKNVLGLGYKEASHFLRNIGVGRNLAILDRHILKNMQAYGIIKKIPKSLTRKEYLQIENLLKEFSNNIGITVEELDLLFWSRETGEIFK